MKHEVPIWEKANLTIEEAAAYFGIGQNRLRKLTEDEHCKFVLYVGTKRLTKDACSSSIWNRRILYN